MNCKKVNKKDFIKIMKFPDEWLEWDMYPDELAELQLAGYEPGHEQGSEHDRNGAFHWWLKHDPNKEQLINLVKLSFLDPDQGLGGHVREYILKSKNCDKEVAELIRNQPV